MSLFKHWTDDKNEQFEHSERGIGHFSDYYAKAPTIDSERGIGHFNDF